jgi:hypothetical protein
MTKPNETDHAGPASFSTDQLERSWMTIPIDDVVHVVPVGENHTLDCVCWCGVHDDDGVLIHNSADNREAFENGTRKPS